MANKILSVEQISKTYKTHSRNQNNKPVINGLSLNLYRGQRIGILGQSGSGKTTLLKLISGLEDIDSGKIVLRGEVVSETDFNLPSHKRQLGYVFQTPALWPHMTVRENISYPAKDKHFNFEELLALFEVSSLSNKFPSQISGGEAKRVAIVRALASNSELLLMDEPLTNLDKALKERIIKILDEYLLKTNTSLIYVTHDEQELESLISITYEIKGGILHEL